MYFREIHKSDSEHRKIFTKIYQHNSDFIKSKSENEEEISNPYVAGTFNQWKFERMFSLQEACKLFDTSAATDIPD